MVGKRCTSQILVVLCALVLVSAFSASVWAQGLPQSPYSAPSLVRGGLDLAPSNPLAMPSGAGQGGSDSIYLSDQMLRGILGPIPNLQVGYLYRFGSSYARSSRLTVDYLLPVAFGGGNSAVFGEAHGEFTNFWDTVSSLWRRVDTTTTTRSGFNERTDLSFGGGYRTILNENTLLGVNGFFDTTKLGSRWYSSGSVGFEMAALLPGNDALDLSFNWYGNLFNSNVLANAFRQGPQNYDFQAGYSHELWNGGPDLRLSATGYRFSSGSGVYGFRGGAELKSRDGVFSVKYETAHDPVNHTYHTVGGFVNVGVQLGNLLNGESPFVMPEPIFRSPRNLTRMLSQGLTGSGRRSWAGRPTSIVLSSSEGEGPCCSGRFRICGVIINHSDDLFGNQVPVGSLADGSQFTVSWCKANSDAQRTGVSITIRQGRTGDARPMIGDFATKTWPMVTESGVMTRTDTQGGDASDNNIQYRELDNNRPLDLIDDGCLCIDW